MGVHMGVHDTAQVLPLYSDEDVVRLRRQVRDSMVAMGFGLIEQTKIITAASELARNTLRYGGGLGRGLGGAKRLADAFYIDTVPGAGTTVTIAKWKLF